MSTNDQPPDPRVDELEAGDVIHTAGLEGMTDPTVEIVESSPIAGHGFWYLRYHPLGQPGAVSHYPQRAATRVTRVERGRPRVADLNIGDVIDTAGLEAVRWPPTVRVVACKRAKRGYVALTATTMAGARLDPVLQAAHIRITRVERGQSDDPAAEDGAL